MIAENSYVLEMVNVYIIKKINKLYVVVMQNLKDRLVKIALKNSQKLVINVMQLTVFNLELWVCVVMEEVNVNLL